MSAREPSSFELSEEVHSPGNFLKDTIDMSRPTERILYEHSNLNELTLSVIPADVVNRGGVTQTWLWDQEPMV